MLKEQYFDFSKIDDQTLDSVFTELGFDGRWSHLTKLLQIAKKKNAPNSLHLDKNWAISPQNYTCPICFRSKVHILKIGKNQLYAALHIDHDHLEDFFIKKIKERHITADIRHFIANLGTFKPIMVCRECNWIDSLIKHKFHGIHRFFSFPPEQKRQIVKISSNYKHSIKLSLAWDVWLECSEHFYHKIDLIERSLHDICHGKKLVGYNSKRYFYEEAFDRFTKNASFSTSGNLSGISFRSFISRSIAT